MWNSFLCRRWLPPNDRPDRTPGSVSGLIDQVGVIVRDAVRELIFQIWPGASVVVVNQNNVFRIVQSDVL